MSELLHLDPDEVRAKLGRQPFRISHELVNHPLTSLDALAELASEVPEDIIEHNQGELPDVADPEAHARAKADMPPAEIVRGIETNGCWIVIPIHSSPRWPCRSPTHPTPGPSTARW